MKHAQLSALWTRPMGAVLLMSLMAACGDGDSERSGSELAVRIVGTPSVFAAVTSVEAAGVAGGAPTAADQGKLQVNIRLCTTDRQRFLSAQELKLRVTRADGQVVETTAERIACRFSSEPGYREQMVMRLEEDGRISANFGEDREIVTYCYPPNRPVPCSMDTL
jgi:hypothetical protein